MDNILAAFERGEISKQEAVTRVLNHPEYGGNRDDAKEIVEEWCACLDDYYGKMPE